MNRRKAKAIMSHAMVAVAWILASVMPRDSVMIRVYAMPSVTKLARFESLSPIASAISRIIVTARLAASTMPIASIRFLEKALALLTSSDTPKFSDRKRTTD